MVGAEDSIVHFILHYFLLAKTGVDLSLQPPWQSWARDNFLASRQRSIASGTSQGPEKIEK